MENKQQPVVNICGSCILRDTFYYQGVYGKEKDGGYRINRYVNFFSPLALGQPPIPIYDRAAYEAFDLKPFGLTNFFRRCRRLDCERSFMKYLNDPADFLLVDTVMFRFQPYQMQVNGQKLICHGEHRPALEAMAKQGILPQLDAEVFSFESLSEEELHHRLQVYANQLKTVCPEERIILVETRHVFLQIDHANHVKSFSSTSQKIYRDGNRRMQKAFGILRELLPQAHLIPFPKQVLAETEHRLGVSGLHYTREYYEYCFQAVETIRKGLPRETEQEQIQALCDACTMQYTETYAGYIEESFAAVDVKKNQLQAERDRFLKYADFFRLYLEQHADVVRFCYKKQIRTIGLYAQNRITLYLRPILEEAGIHVRFIVENLPKSEQEKMKDFPQPFTLLSRGVKQYPETDAILVADVTVPDAIVAACRKRTTVPVYTVYDLLEKKP